MRSAETRSDHIVFEGTASCVAKVMAVEPQPSGENESSVFMLECLGGPQLTGGKPIPILVYIFDDKRDYYAARDYYSTVFEIGSFWRISGPIEYDHDAVVFLAPVYMPYAGDTCELLEHSIITHGNFWEQQTTT